MKCFDPQASIRALLPGARHDKHVEFILPSCKRWIVLTGYLETSPCPHMSQGTWRLLYVLTCHRVPGDFSMSSHVTGHLETSLCPHMSQGTWRLLCVLTCLRKHSRSKIKGAESWWPTRKSVPNIQSIYLWGFKEWCDPKGLCQSNTVRGEAQRTRKAEELTVNLSFLI